MSGTASATFGVPQGSVLGPLYTSKLFSSVKSGLFIYFLRKDEVMVATSRINNDLRVFSQYTERHSSVMPFGQLSKSPRGKLLIVGIYL